MKRMISMVLALGMLLSLAACSKQTDTDGGSDGEESLEGVTIEYWHINSETQGGPVVEELIQEFNETNEKGITVIGKFNANAYSCGYV